MKVIIILIAILLLVGCSNHSPNVVSLNREIVTLNTKFLIVLDDYDPTTLSRAAPNQVETVGVNICNRFSNGQSLIEIKNAAYQAQLAQQDSTLTDDDYGNIIASAVQSYCPKFESKVYR